MVILTHRVYSIIDKWVYCSQKQQQKNQCLLLLEEY